MCSTEMGPTANQRSTAAIHKFVEIIKNGEQGGDQSIVHVGTN